MFEEVILNVAGLTVSARFDTADQSGVFLPLLREWTLLQREKGRRLIVLLGAPPGAGKSTLCAYLEQLAARTPGIAALQTIPLDGFHYPNAYLRAHSARRGELILPLSDIKGAPETFDADALRALLIRADEPDVYFPVYDRRLHEPVPRARRVCGDILLVEGNYLLLNAPPWRDLPADLRVFLDAPEEDLAGRILRRKLQGGFPEAKARAAVERNDRANIRLCREHRLPSDVEITVSGGRYFRTQKRIDPSA